MSRHITSSLKPVSCEMAVTGPIRRKHTSSRGNPLGIALLVLTFLCSCGAPPANNVGPKGDFITVFGGTSLSGMQEFTVS